LNVIISPKQNFVLIFIFFEKAKENLNAATICFNQKLYNASVNRAYHAVFQAAIFALNEIGITHDDNPHVWVQKNFCSELINKRKIISGEFRSYLSNMIRIRHIADYKGVSVSQKRARDQLRDANNFIKEIELKLPHDQ